MILTSFRVLAQTEHTTKKEDSVYYLIDGVGVYGRAVDYNPKMSDSIKAVTSPLRQRYGNDSSVVTKICISSRGDTIYVIEGPFIDSNRKVIEIKDGIEIIYPPKHGTSAKFSNSSEEK